MMKVVHLCYYYGNNTSGAPIAATRLHQALLRVGIESHYVCIDQRDPGENVHVLPKSPLLRRCFYLVVRGFWVLSKLLTGKMLMPNVLPLKGLRKTISEIDPDVIHVQYIGQDMLSFAQLAALPQSKVFTLHDMTIFNAIEPHACDDTRFRDGFSRTNSSWIERWMFGRKQALVEKANMLFTGPSKWICDMFERSIVGRGRIARVVPNIIDPAFAYDASLRRPHEKFTILFGAYLGRSSKYKGWSDLQAALALLPEDVRIDTRVCVFGESAETENLMGIELVFLGAINDPVRLCREYHAADVFALPSRQDNAPQVKFEAFMSGLPVLAFQRTGCAEYIEPRKNGWIAPDGDLKNYAEGLEHFYRLFKNGTLDDLRPGIAAEARAAFSEEAIVRQMREVYATAAGAAALPAGAGAAAIVFARSLL